MTTTRDTASFEESGGRRNGEAASGGLPEKGARPWICRT